MLETSRLGTAGQQLGLIQLLYVREAFQRILVTLSRSCRSQAAAGGPRRIPKYLSKGFYSSSPEFMSQVGMHAVEHIGMLVSKSTFPMNIHELERGISIEDFRVLSNKRSGTNSFCSSREMFTIYIMSAAIVRSALEKRYSSLGRL